MTIPVPRLPALDALKGLGCMLIVWHHLAFYGPMSDVVHPFVPWLTGWLYDYGRMAVQVFLVVAGFLAAASLAPQGVAAFTHPGRLILRRYRRLVSPYLVAVAISVLVAALVRPWFEHSSVPAAPTWLQVIAHVFLLQDLLGKEALSAGLWYVAIDLQLFAVCVLLFSFSHRLFRGRLALAMAVALLLVWLQLRWQSGRAQTGLRLRWLEQVGLMSYSIFLIHFPVCVLVNAVVTYFWPAQLWPNLIGLLAAFALSLLAGAALYFGVEARTTKAPRFPLAGIAPR